MKVKGHYRIDPRSGQRVWVEDHDRTNPTGPSSPASVPATTRDNLTALANIEASPDYRLDPDPDPGPLEQVRGELEAQLADITTNLDTLRTERTGITAELAANSTEISRIEQPRQALIDQNAQLVPTARQAITDIYTRHGITPHMAGLLTNDTIESHTTRHGIRPNPGSTDYRTVLVHPIGTLKIKRGPLRDATKAANDEAATDPALTAANESLRRNIDTLTALPKTDLALIHEATRLRQADLAITRQISDLELQQTATRTRLDALNRDIERITTFQQQHPGTEPRFGTLSGLAAQMRRNPDGTTNVYAWIPDTDHPDNGTWVQATGITAVRSQASTANALTLPDGKLVHDHEHFARTRPGAHTTPARARWLVAVTEEDPHSTPLTDETDATGFQTVTDSTD